MQRDVAEIVLAQLLRQERDREGRPVDGHPHALEQVGQRPDVVFVAVGQEHGTQRVRLREGVRKIGNDVVDAGQVVIGEHEAAVDRDEILAGLDQHHVETDLAEAAEGDQAHERFHQNPFDSGRSS